MLCSLHAVIRHGSRVAGPGLCYDLLWPYVTVSLTALREVLQEDEYGRARVHTQWGNDAELVEEAVQMCPVDCISYVSP